MLELFNADPAEFNDWALVALAPWPAWVFVAVALAALAAVAMSFLGVHEETRRRRVWTLTALRVVGVSLAVVMFLQPAVQLRRVTKIRNRVPVIVDVSQSMSLPTGPDLPTRLEVMSRFITDHKAALDELSRDYSLDFYAFDTEARPITPADVATRLTASGDGTDLLAALHESTASVPQGRLGGVLLFSDGADNARIGREGLPEAAKTFLEGLGAPVHTFGLADEGDFKDLAIEGIEADDLAFVRNTLEVTALIRGAGYAGQSVPVTLRQDDQVLLTRQATLDASGAARVTFQFAPDKIGKFIYGVTVPVFEDEIIRSNNVKYFVVKVVRDKVRVLQVVGRPSWDERFLRKLLKENPNVDLISFFILRTPNDDTGVPQEELSLIPFPTEELFTKQLHTFDLVIFQNFTYGPYGMQGYLRNVHDFVINHGGGFMMVGGELAFSPGGYAGTPIEDILPVTLERTNGHIARAGTNEELNDSDGNVPGVDPTPFKPRLTEEGRRHPLTNLTRGLGDNDALWRDMPELPGLNLVRSLKPSATVLLEHPFQVVDGGKAAPVVVVAEMGRGRSAAVTTDSSWFWNFVHAGRGGARRPYYEFWNNAMRWLIRDPELTRLRLTPDKEAYRPGERVGLELRALDVHYRPAAKAALKIDVTSPLEGSQPISREAVASEDGSYVFELEPLPPGPYRVRASARLGEEDLGTEEEAFVVREAGREFEDARPGGETLRAVAAASGGDAFSLPSATFPELELRKSQAVKVNRKRNIELWDHWTVLAVATLFLGAEWFLRRRWGYL